MNAYFQTERTVVTKVYQYMKSTINDLLSAFLKPAYISKNNLNKLNPKDEKNQLPDDQLYLGANVLTFTSKIQNEAKSPVEQKNVAAMLDDFRTRCRLFLQTACVQMQNRYDFEDKVMTVLHIFNPRSPLTATDIVAPSTLSTRFENATC